MKAFFLESPSFSKEAWLQSFKRRVNPMLESIAENQRKLIRCFYEEEAELHKELTIDKKNNLCINGTPVGDWRRICNPRIDFGDCLFFDYYNKVRIVVFGLMEESDKVIILYEYDKDKSGKLINQKYIYIADKI